MLLQPGQILQHRYQIVQPLGKGAMGAVYLAQDNRLGNKFVAVKQFDPSVLPLQDQQWATKGFTQEAHMLAQLNHTALTAVTDYFNEQGLLYLVMEYVPGQTLEERWLHQPGHRFDLPQILTWARQLCDVLHYLHSHDPPIIFRDLKPSNIMVLPNGKLKLIDFGIARYFKPGQTRDTVALGTPGYAPPEQHGQKQVDARSDIYALAAILHQLLTGHDPALSPFNLQPITSLQAPDPVAKAVKQALSLEPTERPSSARQFCAMLSPIDDHHTARTVTIGFPIKIIATLLALVVVGALMIFWWTSENRMSSVMELSDSATPWATPDSTLTPSTLLDEPPSTTPTSPVSLIYSPSATIPVLTLPAGDTPIFMCTPPACNLGEVYFCLEDCPGGCGTICATVTPSPQPIVQSYTLAYSAAGRPINLTQIGNGPHQIVLIGTMRGAESPDSGQIVIRLREHFQANLELIPADFTLTFIPTLNPDGLAANSRFNAAGVDLNRNWDTPSWTTNAPQPTGIVNGSGGARPFSEPETAALRDLLRDLQGSGESVQVIVFHHHVGTPAHGEVFPGYSSYYTPETKSINLAQLLNRSAGYRYEPFWAGSYVPTGELIHWCALQNMAAVDVILPRDVRPDSQPPGQSRTIFEAALAGILALFN
jgi:serine/threonine protein kinase